MSTDDLCRDVAKLSGGVCLLGFSRGKDSLAAWLQIRKFFSRIIPFHMASVPGLSFVDESLTYYEQFFQTPIERFVSPDVVNAVKNLFFQPGEREEFIDSLELPKHEIKDVVNTVRQKHKMSGAWCAFGIGVNDSINRRGWMKNKKGRNDNTRSFYPCWDWKQADILGILKENNCQLPKDYLLANRSLAGIPNVRHLQRMETAMPDDFAKIEAFLPFIRSVLARNEFRKNRLDKVNQTVTI